jgi:hypothetical protein
VTARGNVFQRDIFFVRNANHIYFTFRLIPV